jgi:Leucine-rich repeat (LRR) protein
MVQEVTFDDYIQTVDLTDTEGFDSLATTLIFETPTLITIPTNFMDDFTQLETVKAEYCGIYVLHKSVFGENHKKQFTNLTSLLLSHNEISTIYNAVFVDAENLRILLLSYNQISVIETAAFQGLKILEKLDLSNNFIIYLDWTIFSENFQLQYLNLEENKISNYSLIPDVTFTPNTTAFQQLQFLYLDFTMDLLENKNSINHIHEKFPLLQELGINQEKLASSCKVLADWLDQCQRWNVTLKRSSYKNSTNIERCVEWSLSVIGCSNTFRWSFIFQFSQ